MILEAPRTATPEANTPASSDLIPILNQIAGKTTLAEAQKLVAYPILLPSYPSDLGDPNLVYVQNAGGYMTILIWLVPGQPDKASMSLHFIPNDSWVIKKFEPKVIQERSVNGQRAVWTEGPYPLILRNSNVEFTRLVNGHVLIWTDGDITYRLETDLPLDEAVKIAESLQSIP